MDNYTLGTDGQFKKRGAKAKAEAKAKVKATARRAKDQKQISTRDPRATQKGKKVLPKRGRPRPPRRTDSTRGN